jgi:hypothetical protein
MGNNMEDRQNDIIESFQSLFEKKSYCQSDRLLPLSIQIYAPTDIGAGE